ncbi:hypothetical protein DHD32_20235 [Arenibacter sp. TNZ]|uniref:hypothetical protein n=1 Tax=Arenibacter TaxID=178469 RepID=UPI000CD3BC14|nr:MULTISPECIES: hypothetical protein [Arenibacter]MCM4173807.1 hypothetical protein [Arenibacter sp. TNZ]
MKKRTFTWHAFTFILLFGLGNGFPIIAQVQTKVDPEWELIKENNREDWKLYKKNVSGSKAFEFKISATINTSIKEAQNAAIDMITNPKFYQSKKGKSYGYFKIIQQKEKSFILYSYMKGPLIFRDRDVVVHYELYENEAKTEMGMKWQHTNAIGFEPREKVIRMPIDIGDWNFKQINSSKCEASQTLQFDPGGSMPKWMINMMVKSRLPEDFNNLKMSVSLINEN